MQALKDALVNIYHSFPVQLLLLHLRKYQVLLIIWAILFSTVGGNFLKTYGANALILAPEYLRQVNFTAAFVTGAAIGVFIMSWNITTFILHTKRFKFLATTTHPFLKYCINNSLLPLIFLLYYSFRMIQFNNYVELKSGWELCSLPIGMLTGVAVSFLFSFAYFFGAEKRIVRTMAPLVANPADFRKNFIDVKEKRYRDVGLKVNFYLTGTFKWKKPRSVMHYREAFIEAVFKRHHLAGMMSILLAFVFLVVIGFFLENRFFELPAAASFLILFAILTAVIGALVYFLASWSLLFAIVLISGLNILYKYEIIDPRNKAYGLRYDLKDNRPQYTKQSLLNICTDEMVEADKRNMIRIMNRWKAKQGKQKPLMVFINVSGGGLRSASFVMSTLQKIDSLSNGDLMKQTFLMTGASGGMLSATYYRELYRLKLLGQDIDLNHPQYSEKITGDLLNPIFTSMIARDLLAPVQHFEVDGQQYIKDRGYAFEQKLSENTDGVLNFQLKDRKEEEAQAKFPLLIFNSVIKRDGRKMMICTQPIRFLMKPSYQNRPDESGPDAVDFNSYFTDLAPEQLRALTALRMNATFPYVLPNVWLPTEPVIDVMDAGLRDNYGLETINRFIHNFQNWIDENTSGVVLLSIRDKQTDNWQLPVLTTTLTDMLINPLTMMQQNMYKMQDYNQISQLDFLMTNSKVPIYPISMVYVPEKEGKMASMNFHISARERKEVQGSFYHPINHQSVQQMIQLLKKY